MDNLKEIINGETCWFEDWYKNEEDEDLSVFDEIREMFQDDLSSLIIIFDYCVNTSEVMNELKRLRITFSTGIFKDGSEWVIFNSVNTLF